MKISLKSRLLCGAAVGLLLALAAEAYERELSGRAIREAYFLGTDRTFRAEEFLEGYVETFPRPESGPHIERIEVVTPFKAVADRAGRAPGSYDPVRAQAEYRKDPPPLVVKVRLRLTPTYPAHSPYNLPIHVGPIHLRDPNFWAEFHYRVVQRGELTPLHYGGDPFHSCPTAGRCWLAGADVTLAFDPEDVASEPIKVIVTAPGGQQVEAEFDLGKLR